MPYLDGIEFWAFTAGNVMDHTITSWFTSKSTDLMLGGLVHPHFQTSLGDPAEEGFNLIESWDTLYEVMVFQLADTRYEVNPDSLNGELAYRQAVLNAIDRTALSAEMGGPVISSIVGTALPGTEQGVWDQYDNPAQFDVLLDRLGAELGRDFTNRPASAVYVSSRGDSTFLIGENIAAQLSNTGIATSTDFDGDFFGTQLPEGLTDLFAFRTFALPGTSGLMQSLSLFDPSLPEDQLILDWSSIGEPAQPYAAIFDEAAITLDQGRLLELLQEAEAILADNAIIYPLVRRQVNLHPYWPERIQGFVPNQQQGWDTATAAYWWSPEG